MFKHHRYPKAIILQAVYFKLRFTLSYRDVEELLKIRCVKVDHSNIQRWVFMFSSLVEANMHKRKKQVCDSWRMVETYIKVGGKDRYLYRAVDKQGNMQHSSYWEYSGFFRINPKLFVLIINLDVREKLKH